MGLPLDAAAAQAKAISTIPPSALRGPESPRAHKAEAAARHRRYYAAHREQRRAYYAAHREQRRA